MRSRRLIWILSSLLLLAGAWLFWHHAGRSLAQKKSMARPTVVTSRSASTAPQFLTHPAVATKVVKTGASATNEFAYRLSNTSKSIGELVHDDKAILLENALIDTRRPLNFSIPKNLQSEGDPGAYIVQANGPIDNAFRAMLAAAGATIVSYIPNDAYLVRISGTAANEMTSQGFTVIPYEPYYKMQSSLLDAISENQPVTELKVAVFPNAAEATMTALENTGAKIIAQEPSPFGGAILTVQNVSDVAAVAQMPGVQIVEPYHKRVLLNDLARVTLGVATNTTAAATANYMGLTGKNVTVEVNDTGIDAQHPDFATGRVIGDAPQSLVDTNGHGTHVAGIIAGNGLESGTINQPPHLPQGSVTNAIFCGKAPAATLYSVGGIDGGDDTNVITDAYFQEQPALTNALISNNSWGNDDSTYDLSAASYDAAVRDALPGVSGSQPVLFVFAAGNDGGGDNGGGGGNPDTISSPGTAKNVVTVGALEQLRNITNYVTALNGTSNQVWLPMTDTSFEVAGYSSRGNVGIGTEGTFGRFKPDVVAPGTFVVSTRSEQWDQAAYYNPTNFSEQDYTDQTVDTNAVQYYNIHLSTTPNAVGVTIQVVPNDFTIGTLNLPIYIPLTPSPGNFPNPTDPATYESPVETNTITIPPDPNGGGVAYLTTALANRGFNFAVGNSGTQPADYDLIVEITTTNDNGNYFEVLSNQLNAPLAPWYRYETGTSMSAPAVSGVLALMQDYFTNTLRALPSPALFKAMLINGARPTGFNDLQVENSINFEGWGLANLPDSLPSGITTNFNTACSSFILDQSPNTALATGDSRTLGVNVSSNAEAQPLRVTLAWTDPPGNPAAAIKLVNNLVLIVTNLDNPTNPIVYFGNDISTGDFNNQENTNSVLDAINNVQNVYLPAGAGTNFSVTVMGYRVNVNAVTAQTNNSVGAYAPNVVQDYALVISSGNGQTNNAITVTNHPIVSNPTGDQQITLVAPGSGALLNQFAGANSPLLGTNTLLFNGTAPENLGANWQVTIGQTNQWHFYVVTNPPSNSSGFTNAAFITFMPDTLSIPRMGVFADSQANATQPEADIDLYVSTNSALTNLDPNVISNAIVGGTVSLGRSGDEFVVFTNSAPSDIYYIGVKSETQEGSEYAFLPVFSQTPFSGLDNGIEIVNGLEVPLPIPGGDPAVPGYTDVVALATYPITAQRVVVTNVFTAQNFGDLVGALNHDGTSVILNNHDSFNSPITNQMFIYDDSGENDIPNSQPSDGPGSLNDFLGTDGTGVWRLHEANNAQGFSNVVDNFTLAIYPANGLGGGTNVTVQPNSWFYGFVVVPPGATNLTVIVTNFTGTASPPLEMFIKYGALPTTNSFDEMTEITNATLIPPAVDGSISIGPPLTSGVYYVGVFNPNGNPPQDFFIIANVNGPPAPQVDFTSSGPVPLLDDAVTTNSLFVTQDKIISSVDVGLRVDHPRVSDLVFHLISPDGTRVLLVENRGGYTTNGMGVTLTTSNTVVQAQTSSGGSGASTNVINTGQASGILTVQYNFYSLPDEMVVYDQAPPLTTNALIFNSGLVSGSGVFNIPYTNAPLTIIMNPNGNNSGPGDLWDYTVDATGPSYDYLVLTENTNLTTTPIKFAVPPFVPAIAWQNGFEESIPNPNLVQAGNYFDGGWLVTFGNIEVLGPATGPAYSGNNFIDLDGFVPGGISTNITTVPGQIYTLEFAYSRNPDSIPNITPQAAVLVNGIQLATVVGNQNDTWSNLQWRTTSVVFTATSNSTSLTINSLDPGSSSTGVLLDAFTLSTPLAYLPEQPLDVFDGEDALGQWTLEVQDDRAGATNPAPSLVSWQLRFNFTTATSSIGTLTNNVPLTNTVPPDSIAYYLVNVPINADFATNSLFMTNGPLSLLFNEANPPTGTNAGDTLLFSASANDSTVLSTLSTPTNIVPGGSYYLGVLNTNPFAVNYDIEVNFHLILPPAPITNYPVSKIVFTNIGGTNGILLTWLAPTNYQFQIQWTTNLVPPVSWTTIPGAVPTLVAVTPTNGTFQYFDDFSLTGGFGHLKFYRLIAYPPGAPILVTGTLANGVPQTNSIPADSVGYYLVNVPTNADFGTNSLSLTNGPLSLWFNETNSPDGMNPGDQLLFSASNNDSTVLSTTSTPTNIVPGGSYYLGVLNTNPFAVNYDIEVNFHLVPPPPTVPVTNYPISSVVVTNIGGTNGILLTWFAPTNYQFQIQWTTSLTPTIFWGTIPGAVPTLVTVAANGTGTYQYFDDFSLTGGPGLLKFYRLIAYAPGVPIPAAPTLSIVNRQFTAGGIQFQWSAPTNYQYEIQWTTNLALPPANWFILTNPVLSVSNGVFTFADTNQTGPSTRTKFFRVIEY